MKRLLLAGLLPLVLVLIGGVALAAVFTETFTGTPPAPLAFSSEHWETSWHPNWTSPTESVTPGEAHHTATCGSPGELGENTHPVSLVKDLVFKCNDHVMTLVPGGLPGDYGVIYLTPDQMVDFSGGTASVKFDVSTFASSTRDWLDVWVQAWDTQEQKILDNEIPTAQGNPRNAVHIENGGGCCSFRAGEGQFHVESYDNNRNRVASIPAAGRWIDVLTPSAVTRSTVEILISQTHVKVWMPQYGLILAEGDIPALGFTQGVVSLGHHSYSPWKGAEGGNLNGDENTWHWDNITINPSAPFSIIHSDHRAAFYYESDAARTFIFDRPAPANSFLRFEAYGDQVMASYDGGAFGPVVRTGPKAFVENASSYFSPVPTGATRVILRVDNPGFGFVGFLAEVHVFSRTADAPTVTATTTPTVTPTVIPTPTNTPTATPTQTPGPRTVRCQVKNTNNNNYTTLWGPELERHPARPCP